MENPKERKRAPKWKTLESLTRVQGADLTARQRNAVQFYRMRKQGNASRDRGLVSDEPYEIEYIHRQFPNHSHDEVHRAIRAAKAEMKGSENRERIMQILRQKLK